jgi:hypothetical protein
MPRDCVAPVRNAKIRNNSVISLFLLEGQIARLPSQCLSRIPFYQMRFRFVKDSPLPTCVAMSVNNPDCAPMIIDN